METGIFLMEKGIELAENLDKARMLHTRLKVKTPNRVDLADAYTTFRELTNTINKMPQMVKVTPANLHLIKESAGNMRLVAKDLYELLVQHQPNTNWYTPITDTEAKLLTPDAKAETFEDWSLTLVKEKTIITALGPHTTPQETSRNTSWATLSALNQFIVSLPDNTVGNIGLMPTQLVPEEVEHIKVTSLNQVERHDLLHQAAVTYQAETQMLGKEPSLEELVVRSLAVNYDDSRPAQEEG